MTITAGAPPPCGDADSADRAALLLGALDGLDSGIIVLDRDDRVAAWNRQLGWMAPGVAAALRVGITFAELVAIAADVAVAKGSIVSRDAYVRARLAQHASPGVDFDVARGDGRTVRIREERIAGGGSVISYREVTAEAAATAAAAQAAARTDASESRFRDFAEVSSDWFWETGPDGRITWISSGIERFGVDPETLLNRGRAELPYTVPSGQPGIAQIAAATANREAFKDIEYESIVRSDGRRATIVVSGVPVFSPDGRFLGHRGTGRDVTAARRRDRELEHQSHLLQTIFSSMDEGISVFDREFRLVAWNERFPELTGASGLRTGMALRDVLICQARAGEFGPCDPEAEADRRIDTRWTESALVSERRRPDGRTIELRRHPVAGGGVVTIFVDITERKTRELRLAEAAARERDLAAQQRRFVSIVAHEFRTPMTIIDGAAQRIARSGLQAGPEDLKTRVEKIRGAVGRMSLLIDTMLNSARLDAGSIETNLASVDVVGLVKTVVARQEGIAPAYDFVVESKAPTIEIHGDARLLDQVFTNLISNAVKYSGDSRRVEIAIVGTDEGVQVAVRDFGIGVPEDEIPSLFTRFFRASTAKGLPGTGIGLNLVKELVQLHGGSVTVESRVGAGTRFTVTLPSKIDAIRQNPAAA